MCSDGATERSLHADPVEDHSTQVDSLTLFHSEFVRDGRQQGDHSNAREVELGQPVPTDSPDRTDQHDSWQDDSGNAQALRQLDADIVRLGSLPPQLKIHDVEVLMC